jgi:hypothetical protein
MRENIAARQDPVTGAIEEVGFFGDTPRMMGWTHIPAEDVIGGVVICSSTHAELLKAYHLEVQLARALASRGVAVQRFHYRGDGNSEGRPQDLTLPNMVTAALEAKDLLETRVNVDRVATVGVRLGAFPAITIVESGQPSILWDPVINTHRFFRDAIRSHAISGIKGGAQPERESVILERLESEGSIEVLGYEITSEFYRSVSNHDLTTLTPDGPILLVPFGTAEVEPLIEAWQEKSTDVTEFDGTANEAWWLDEQASHDRHERSSILIRGSADWIVAQFQS